MRAPAAMTACLVLALAGPAPLAAQLGLRGGMNLSRFVGGSEDTESDTRLNLGASIPLLRLGPISIGPEIYYAQKGAGAVPTQSSDPTRQLADFHLDYIEVPVLAKLSIALPGMRSLRPYVQAGPAFAWQLKCEVSYQSVSSGAFQTCDDPLLSGDAREAFESADRGMVAGAGIDLVVGSIGLVTLDARMVRGLARISESAAVDGEAKNQTLTLMLGYAFGVPGWY